MNGSTSTLVLTTLISILGWLAVTMYSGTTELRTNQQALALQVNTLEVKSIGVVTPIDVVRVSNSVQEVASAQSELEEQIDKRISTLEAQISQLQVLLSQNTIIK